MQATETDRADVFRGAQKLGRLERTRSGSTFHFDPQANEPRDLSFTVPFSKVPVTTSGVNLHPFFAGLLPEGIRLSAIRRRVKTSEDDLFSLLIAVGRDCIGDISIVPEGEAPKTHPARFDANELQAESFKDLLSHSLELELEDLDPTVPGVQEKISGGMISIPLAIRSKRSPACILKLDPEDRPLLVRNEHFFMKMAADCGLETATCSLVQDRDGQDGLLVHRFDRVVTSGNDTNHAVEVVKVHQEDGCQILDRYAADKYRLRARDLAEAISEFTSAPAVETLRFLELHAFSFLIGNGDFHAKNLSLRIEPESKLVRLSPAYDLLSTQAYRGLDQRMPIKLDGRDDAFRAQHYLEFGVRHGVSTAATTGMLKRLVKRSEPWIDRVEEVPWERRDRERIRRCLIERRQALTPT